ncbi:MAG TPA: type VI secretion system baseplate subunit TssG [Microvirga sp.]|jgi:type VI secretion system protein ImpH|nr:type VI secretion system baseplate subunit TssG [Microvirga sp.]
MSYLDDLEQEPYRFDFYAVLRRLERTHADKPRIGDSAARRDEYVLLGEDPYLDFPASNLAKAQRDEQKRLRIMTKFLGLLGPQGALPLAITEEVYDWFYRGDDAFPRFLDILHHRFLQLFFRAWADARPVAQHDRPKEDRFRDYVGSAIGIGSKPYRALDSVPDEAKLAYAGLIGAEAKSGSRLAAFISGVLKAEASVEEFVASRLVFDTAERTLLGRRFTALGVDALVGGSVFSLEDKVRIKIFVRTLPEYQRFLPSGDKCEPLADLVYLYMGDQLDWDVELAIPAEETRPIQLSRFGQLGWTSWISREPEQNKGQVRRDARFHPAARRRQRRKQTI